MGEKKYFDEITLMKGWCILLAVVGHSFPDAVKGFNIFAKILLLIFYWGGFTVFTWLHFLLVLVS